MFAFKLSRDVSARVFPGSGVDAAFHPASHHQEKPERLADYQKINTYHVSMLPYFLSKLKNIAEGDSNLLERSLILYGSPMGDSNLHNHRRLPLIMMGHANGELKGNRHIEAPDGYPMANVWLSVLNKLGVEKEKFSDSTGAMELNSTVTTTA